MYNRPKRINNLKNTLFKIKFKNINSRHSISNAYVKVEIFNNEGTTNLEIVLDNLIDILEHDNIHNNISDNEYFVVRDNNYYLVNDKLSIYNEVINDLDERKKLNKKTTKYKIGGIYGSIINQYLYCGTVNYFLKDDITKNCKNYNISDIINFKPLEKPIKKHLLIYLNYKEINLIKNKDIKTLKEFFNYKIKNGTILNISGFIDKLNARSEIGLLENDIEKDFLEENVFSNVLNLCTEFFTINKLNPDFNFPYNNINYELLFVSLKDKLKENNVEKLIKLVKSYDSFHGININDERYY